MQAEGRIYIIFDQHSIFRGLLVLLMRILKLEHALKVLFFFCFPFSSLVILVMDLYRGSNSQMTTQHTGQFWTIQPNLSHTYYRDNIRRLCSGQPLRAINAENNCNSNIRSLFMKGENA